MSKAVRKDKNGEDYEIPHITETEAGSHVVCMSGLYEVLREHEFQEAERPFLVPKQPTVCSCGAIPLDLNEESERRWWRDHVLTELMEKGCTCE